MNRLSPILFLFLVSGTSFSQVAPIIIRTGQLLTGDGKTFIEDVDLIVENGKILRVERSSSIPATYDLSRFTIMPGWIDTHTHITWHFGPNGKFGEKEETPEQAAIAAAGNAYATLMAGFTTIQCLGAPEDLALRDAINKGTIPGPRILTAVTPLSNAKLTADEIKAAIRKAKEDGADVIKIFASGSIRQGGVQTLTNEQLKVACDEAKAVGLRSVVHAYGTAVGAAANAGCTTVEHGTFATQAELDAMASNGTFFDPNVGLVLHNYLDNKSKFLGVGTYTEEGFAKMEEVLPLISEMFKKALKTKNLKIVFGTDALAGSHGRNAEEFIYRVEAGQKRLDALVAANSLAAESLNLQNEIGSIKPGLQADIIALDGDPLKDITAVRRVVFVMKGGKVFKNVAGDLGRPRK